MNRSPEQFLDKALEQIPEQIPGNLALPAPHVVP